LSSPIRRNWAVRGRDIPPNLPICRDSGCLYLAPGPTGFAPDGRLSGFQSTWICRSRIP
jgi:hypothetical protein